MIELVADRLVLVDGGLAQEFNGTLEDYTDFVLARGRPARPRRRTRRQNDAPRPKRVNASGLCRAKRPSWKKQSPILRKNVRELIAPCLIPPPPDRERRPRSEESGVGEECGNTCKARRSP